jgi:hypothetical protein
MIRPTPGIVVESGVKSVVLIVATIRVEDMGKPGDGRDVYVIIAVTLLW